MTALPPSTKATGAATTEGEFKTFISDLRAFLAGLLGTDGVAATARATLGVPEGSSIVQSFNSRTGAVTLSSGDVTVALGYTPANQSSVAGINTNYDWELKWSGKAGTSVNIYSNYGPGVYCARTSGGAIFHPFGAYSWYPTLSVGTSGDGTAYLYKLKKLA